MAHRSEEARRLVVRRTRACEPAEIVSLSSREPAVWAFVLPTDPRARPTALSKEWVSALRAFSEKADARTTVAILTSPEVAARLWPELERELKFQLWVAIKLKEPLANPDGLPFHHAALLILTRYSESLRHTKTRIAYTYCPSCDRTTKDYGGKKHTYDPYGTLVSDVWRDIVCTTDDWPEAVIDRLRDLFGMDPYRELVAVDVSNPGVLQTPGTASSGRVGIAQAREDARPPSELLQGDCLELLRRIPTDSMDFCFADPPYNLKKKYDNWDDGIDIREYFEWCDQWLGETARVLKPGRTLAVLNIPLWAIRHFSYLQTVLNFHSWIVWEGLSLPVRMIMPAHYSIVCFSKGRARPLPGVQRDGNSRLEREALNALKEFYCIRQDCVNTRRLSEQLDTQPLTDLWWDIHRLKHNSRRVEHPCQLPPSLMRRLIALFTNEGECVLDPFNGAGTTTLAAEELGRRFVGLELSSAYHELALKRHAQLRAGADPFAKNHRIPRAKNSNVKRLRKQRYAVPKKELQLEIRRIAQELGRLPTREDVMACGRFPIAYYDEYFISWGEVCAAARNAGMSETRVFRLRPAAVRQPLLFDQKGSD